MISSFTACHIDTIGKIPLLSNMIESLLINKINNIYISFSFKNTFFDGRTEIRFQIRQIVNKLKNKYTSSKIYLFWQNKQDWFQFDHLNYIYDNYMGKNTDRILFIDDDDLLLNLPKTTANIRGYQYLSDTYLTDDTYKMDYFELSSKINWFYKYFTKLSFKNINDFSGYICSYENLHEFFKLWKIKKKDYDNSSQITKNITRPIIMMTDIQFMDYLDLLDCSTPSTPFIFHRVWVATDRTNSTWRESLNILFKNLY